LEPRIAPDGFWSQTEIVWLCCGTDVKQEGLFRKAGNVDRQRVLCDRLDSAEAQLLLHEFTVHDCATVLKTFLGEMPEPLLVEKYCTAYRQVAGLLDSNATWVICVFIILAHACCLKFWVTTDEEKLQKSETLRLLED